MKKNDFYIGYINQIPNGIRNKIRKTITAICVLFLMSGMTIAIHHKYESTAKSELGQITTIEGYFYKKPVPLIKVFQGKDQYGQYVFKSIPLVNYAKFGAEELLSSYEIKNNISLNGKLLKLEGSFLYDDGKALFELTNQEESILAVNELNNTELDLLIQPQIEELGVNTLKGEIVDSKCYFGAMRPGFGKTHRSCAVRCISGGIPPVLAATNYEGEVNYFLIRGENEEAINDDLLTYVAEPVSITGRLVRIDDWMVIYVNPNNGISRE